MSAGPGVPQGAGAGDLLIELLRVGVYAVAAVLIVFAIWLLWGKRGEEAIARRTGRRTGRPVGRDIGERGRVKWWFGGIAAWSEDMTTPTRMTFALSSLLLGYHMAAWTAPGHVLPFRIPLDLWFVLVGGAAFACLASVWMDRREANERRADEE